jgi:replicative DNA helicase Mcm
LKFISNIAPKGRYIVGMAASGAGITATVVKDEFLKGWSLEAGAMVLANKGVICIDEIEKMGAEDRSAMHEALEQQTVTISKANVQACLSAQTSVLAAGNPKFGRFEPTQPVAQQIDLPPALINRFDLIFILRDLPNEKQDDAIASHVLRMHQKKDSKSAVDRELFRKYVAYAKQKCEPDLTDEAFEEIKNFYVKLRNASTQSEGGSISISARQLQGLVRLSEAHAKTRLSSTVDRQDAQVAIKLTRYYMLQVGYDPETKSFDVDRATSKISSSERSKIIQIKEMVKKLEEKYGKQISLDILREQFGDKISDHDFEEAIEKLKKSGDLFQPKSGFVQGI